MAAGFAQKGEPLSKPKPTLIQRLFRAVGYEDRAYNIHNDGKIATYFTNYGLIGYFNPSVEYPTNTERYYAWQIGIMIGAMVDTSDDGTSNAVPLVSDTYQDYGEKNFNPIAGLNSGGYSPTVAMSDDPDSWPLNWPAEIPIGSSGWPGLQLFDYEPIGSQESYWIMRDFDNEAFDLWGEGKPGVGALEVISRGIQSNSTLTNRFLFYQYDIVNKSSSTIRGGRFGILVDPDHPAHLETEYGDDSAEFVSNLNLAVSYDYDNNYSEWPGVDLAYMGIQFLKSPTDSNGELLGMTSWKSFTYGRMPQSGEIGGVLYKSRDEAQYDYMKPGIFSPSPQVNKDIVYVMASGDFTIAPKDTQSVVVAILTADSREQLIKTAEAALAVFNNDFKTPSAPDPPLVNAVTGDEQVTLYWDAESAENSRDRLTGKADFEGYRIYRSTDLGASWGETTDDLTTYPLGFKPLADFNKFNTVEELGTIETAHTSINSNATIEALGIVPSTTNFVENTYLITFLTDTTFSVYDSRNGWLLSLNRQFLTDGFSILHTGNWDTDPKFVYVSGSDPITVAPYTSGKLIYVGGAVVQLKNSSEDCDSVPEDCIKTGDVFQVKTRLLDSGMDNGLMHSWIDTTVVNGVEYWYAVTAYDRSDLMLDVPLNELNPATTPNTLANPHTVSVIPSKPLNGIEKGRLSDEGVEHISGVSTSAIIVDIYDPDLLTETEYTVGIHYTSELEKSYYLIEKTTAQDTILNHMPVVPAELSWMGYDNGPIINGFRLSVIDDPADTLSFLLVEGDSSHYLGGNVAVDLPGSIRAPQVPRRDLEIVFDNSGYESRYGGQPKQNVVSVPFSVWDITDSTNRFQLHSLFKDRNPRDEWGPNDDISVLSVPIGSEFPSGNFNSVKANYALFTLSFGFDEADSLYESTLWQGDRWQLLTMRPLQSDDVFRFSTVAPKTLDKPDLDLVKVVPNPFVVSAAWDSREGQYRLQFTNLPETCTIKLYTVSGDLVRTIEHNGGSFEWWDLHNESDMEVAFGVYLYHIKTESNGGMLETTGKIMVVR
ncbi:MAG: hypothetical protein CMG71_07705 [Candidatus Marinimicrobia bacterium]|nr:hypothetical protein [Candidatus Neomarinimicrobiota bacterium]|tara:strand:- start:154 stop:3297 length:3144 start_codon:yes stop_codon:yes gene_type:complete